MESLKLQHLISYWSTCMSKYSVNYQMSPSENSPSDNDTMDQFRKTMHSYSAFILKNNLKMIAIAVIFTISWTVLIIVPSSTFGKTFTLPLSIWKVTYTILKFHLLRVRWNFKIEWVSFHRYEATALTTNDFIRNNPVCKWIQIKQELLIQIFCAHSDSPNTHYAYLKV